MVLAEAVKEPAVRRSHAGEDLADRRGLVAAFLEDRATATKIAWQVRIGRFRVTPPELLRPMRPKTR